MEGTKFDDYLKKKLKNKKFKKHYEAFSWMLDIAIAGGVCPVCDSKYPRQSKLMRQSAERRRNI